MKVQIQMSDKVQKRARHGLRPTLLAALLAGGLHASSACALGLGGLTQKSALGETFRADIALLGDDRDTPGSNCFALDVPAASGVDDLPWLSQARLSVRGRTLSIRSSQPINDPVLMLGIRVGCGHEIAREYTVLLQPVIARLPDAEAVGSATMAGKRLPADTRGDAATTAAPPQARATTADSTAGKVPGDTPRSQRRTKRAAADANRLRDRLFVAPGADGGGLQMSAGLSSRPTASEAEREALRTEQKLLAALDEQIATHLAISEKVRQLEARLQALQQQLGQTDQALDRAGAPSPAGQAPSVPPVAAVETMATPLADGGTEAPAPITVAEEDGGEVAPAPPPGLTNEPVRVVTKLPPDGAPAASTEPGPAGIGLDWPVLALGLGAASAILGGGWLLRRRSRSIAEARARRQLELDARLAAAKQESRREQRAADVEYAQHGEDATPSRPVPARELPAANAAAATSPTVESVEHFPGEAPDEHIEHLHFLPPAAVDGTTTADSVREVPARLDFELGDADMPDSGENATTRLDLEFDSFVGSANALDDGIRTQIDERALRLVSSDPLPTSGLQFEQGARSANEETPPSHEHVLELAEIMMSFGRAEGAAQTLSEFLRDYPKESIIPWLKLLDLYHRNGQRGEYNDLAPKLNRAFNVKVPDWDDFKGPITTETVEQFPHIMARIAADWPNQACLDYMTELLRDNRDGARVGFPLGVIDDILLLKSVLEWLIANPSVTATHTSRLALL
ncbi:type IV pilus assembly protein FimV [Methyloversatilis thermotolerans]|uniref:type IV pilus assembly protein FimV n=1 Tax=Methyloversatilis thermotolerans TaxID=1346290 RepID=UPI00039CC660|nr:hypothetical protein [Methyloversatilis thermotolerans]